MRTPVDHLAALAVAAVVVLLLAACSPAAGPFSSGEAAEATATAAVASAPASEDPSAGNGGEAGTPTIPADPCSLLSLAEATEAYGTPITETVKGDAGCSYSGPEQGFLLTFSSLDRDLAWQVSQAGLKAQAGSAPPIAGVGDRAIGTKGTVDAQQGANTIGVTAAHDGYDPDASKAAAVAKVVLSHL